VWLFIIAIFLFCFLLIVAIVVLIRNVKEIRTDPILYGMEKRGYDICSCVQEDGMRIDYTIGVPELFYLNEERVTDGAG